MIEQDYHQHHVMMMIHDLFSLSVVCLKAKYFICIFSIHWLFCLAGMFFTLGLNGSQVTIFKGMVILFDFLVFEQIFWLLEQIFWVLESYPVVISLSLSWLRLTNCPLFQDRSTVWLVGSVYIEELKSIIINIFLLLYFPQNMKIYCRQNMKRYCRQNMPKSFLVWNKRIKAKPDAGEIL